MSTEPSVEEEIAIEVRHTKAMQEAEMIKHMPTSLLNSIHKGTTICKYKWSQTAKDITIQVPLPEGTKGKNVFLAYID